MLLLLAEGVVVHADRHVRTLKVPESQFATTLYSNNTCLIIKICQLLTVLQIVVEIRNQFVGVLLREWCFLLAPGTRWEHHTTFKPIFPYIFIKLTILVVLISKIINFHRMAPIIPQNSNITSINSRHTLIYLAHHCLSSQNLLAVLPSLLLFLYLDLLGGYLGGAI